MTAGERAAPVLPHPDEGPGLPVRPLAVLQVGDPGPVQGGLEERSASVLNTNGPSTRTLGSRPSFPNSRAWNLPCVGRRGLMQARAVRSSGRRGLARPARHEGAAAMRMSGPIRTAVMSSATMPSERGSAESGTVFRVTRRRTVPSGCSAPGGSSSGSSRCSPACHLPAADPETVTQVGVTALCLILLLGSRLYGLLIATPVATAVIGIATMVLGGSPVAVTVLAWRQGSRRRPDGGMIPGRGLERQRWAVTERTPGAPWGRFRFRPRPAGGGVGSGMEADGAVRSTTVSARARRPARDWRARERAATTTAHPGRHG
ncbi:hypothetical protein C7388_105112 [Methylobacterium radiotolerans]|nr:hypothetical protein C7388_105112 [Methylobacterium organophilum]